MLPHPARMCKHMRLELMQRFPNPRITQAKLHIVTGYDKVSTISRNLKNPRDVLNNSD